MATQPITPSAPALIPVRDIHPAQWHAERALGIGGSESAAMFNEGHGCHRQLILEKRGVPADYKHTESTELLFLRGNMLEEVVATVFKMKTGLKIRRQPSKVSKSHPHARVNIDRQIVAVDPMHLYKLTQDKDGFSPLADILDAPGPGYLECKTMNPWDFKRFQKEGLSKHPHYILQLQHGLAVTGYRWGVFAILDTTTFDMEWFPVLRDEALCAEILARTEESWALVEDTRTPLPAHLPDKDRRCNKCLWRRTCRGDQYLAAHAGADFSTDYVDTTDPELLELATDFIAADEEESRAAALSTAIKAKIKARMDADGIKKLRVPDVIKFCLSTSDGRKTWDGKAIEGEINALNKGELPALDGVDPDVLTGNAQLLATVLQAVAARLRACQKTGAPSTSFRPFAV